MEYLPGGDIFAQDVQCIINPVNCQVHRLTPGYQRGLAGLFEERFPESQPPLRSACEKGLMKPGFVQLLRLDRQSGERRKDGDLYIAHLATKDHWSPPSQLKWIDSGLAKLAAKIGETGIKSVAIPTLGAGLGKLPWQAVRGSVEKRFGPLADQGVRVIVLGEGREMGERPAHQETPPVCRPDTDFLEGARYYAGIGARDTPAAAIAKMRKIGEILAKEGVILRSGGAKGADSAFEDGCDMVDPQLKQIFLGWDGYNDKKANGQTLIANRLADNAPEVRIAQSYYHRSTFMPNGDIQRWNNLGRGGKALMARNTNQILGPDVSRSPLTGLVVCWTKNGEVVGGTGQALRIAIDKNIPVLNLGDPRLRNVSAEALGAMAQGLLGGRTLQDVMTMHASVGAARQVSACR